MTFSTLRAAAFVAVLALGASSALAQPNITVTPASFDLGDLSVPGGTNIEVQVQNDGDAPLTLTNAFATDLTGDGAFGETFSPSLFPRTLVSGESVELGLVVSPRVGRQNGTLTIESDDPDEATVIVPITFFGTRITFGPVPDSLDFGQITVTVNEFGDTVAPPTVCLPVSFTTAGDEGGYADDFEIDGSFDFSTPDGDLIFSGGDTVSFDVCYTPAELGEATAELMFSVGSLVNGFEEFGRDITLVVEAVLNQAPVPQGIADGDVIDVTVDTPKTINFAFASPEAGQTTTIEVSDLDEFFDFSFTTTPGNPATGEIRFSPSNGTGGYTVGDYGLTIEACDDAPDGEDTCTTVGITARVSYPPTKACDFDVWFYINTFATDPADNYFQLYSSESGLVDLTGCSFVAFDAITEEVVVSLPLTFELYPYGEPRLFADGDFAGAIPSGPGAIAIVKGAPALGDDVSTVFGKAVNAIVYRTADDVVGVCGEGTPFNASGYPTEPCSSTASESAIAAALSQIGTAVSAEDAAELDLSLAIVPNPTARAGTVSFGLADAGDAYVALFDALGRQVAVLAEGPYGIGRHEVSLDASGLPAGVYIVRAVLGGQVQTAQLTVVR